LASGLDAVGGDQLQVVDDDQVEARGALQAPGAGASLAMLRPPVASM
jgi:hypothetical protein